MLCPNTIAIKVGEYIPFFVDTVLSEHVKV
jgi:hypothetical protein